ncbi:RNA 2',3'-cyclic phosphodiesterase [Aestuariivirga litoralis]|uniref:RNA 2',3'-cyclic phosphodiesterase n=1 Tax=Aestuariivirga litoralis TaxID=2650924 RepID=UPI0018C55604|nr:RNA 2',3'-cyclic phosphodiesterase [Aestuariivirga litoralis]MBG1233674.1 RNA 2',3'-cyclic phosphodiesterase [Aestuariivirga litoralis]
MMRLFTGLELPSDISLDLNFMQGGIEGARWIDRENFHITLRFIGDIDDALGREVTMALDEAAIRPFQVAIKSIDVFGGNKPHAIIARIEENPELMRLQLAQERICQSLGLQPEGRKFIPHVTLARLRDPDPRALRSFIESHALYRSRPFMVEHFVLFSSKPSRGGGPYAVEESYGAAYA